ncbi:MAG: SRPBCC family protein [Hyphomicrobiaceae bacterium]
MTPDDALNTWSLDREIVLVRVIAAPRDRVFEAWSGAHHVARWFGPEGFQIETVEADIREDGRWRFIFVGPDGTRHDNRIAYLEIATPHRLVFDHGPDQDHAPERFRVTVTFDEQQDGKTVVTLRQLHPTKAQRDATIAFGAVEFGGQTLEKLARYVTGTE